MYSFSLEESFSNNQLEYILFPFIDENGVPLKNSPKCGLTLCSAGSMRFRWNENNPVRDKVLKNIENNLGSNGDYNFIPVQLEHTKIVYPVNSLEDTKNKIGDGILTLNRNLIPTVTVADCVPIYLFNKKTGLFGIVHSGWKGTGIGAEALKLAKNKFDSDSEDFFVVIGPHIKSCCYIVNEERAKYFSDNFTPECVSPLESDLYSSVTWNNGGGKLFRLSLDKANVAMFRKFGVPDNHIAVCSDCTCCSCNNIYGSNRRETSASGKPDQFTVMAAFISY